MMIPISVVHLFLTRVLAFAFVFGPALRLRFAFRFSLQTERIILAGIFRFAFRLGLAFALRFALRLRLGLALRPIALLPSPTSATSSSPHGPFDQTAEFFTTGSGRSDGGSHQSRSDEFHKVTSVVGQLFSIFRFTWLEILLFQGHSTSKKTFQ